MKAAVLNEKLPASELCEGPYWDAKDGCLYWVDIIGKKIHRYNTTDKSHAECGVSTTVGFAIPDRNGFFVAGLGENIQRLNFRTGESNTLIKPTMHADNRFNDGKCDGKGRLWAGTMHKHKANDLATGSLYRFDDRGLVEFEKDIHIANGIGWSPDYKTMYFTDTVRKTIWQYDYDLETGEPTNKRVFLKFEGPGRPDGLAIDSKGMIYTAQWPGWGVEIFTPNGERQGRIDLPVPQVSSCAFGGADLKTLFITTAFEDMSEAQLKDAPLSGHVFTADLDIAGMAVSEYAG